MTNKPTVQHPAWAALSLLTSFGTLVCCALPSLFVFLGLGATVASSLVSLPWLVELSKHKAIVFTASGTLISLNLVYVYRVAPAMRAGRDRCEAGDACAAADRLTRTLLWLSVVLYLVGFFAAFLLAPLIMRFDPTIS